MLLGGSKVELGYIAVIEGLVLILRTTSIHLNHYIQVARALFQLLEAKLATLDV